jgi:hypothetical protein
MKDTKKYRTADYEFIRPHENFRNYAGDIVAVVGTFESFNSLRREFSVAMFKNFRHIKNANDLRGIRFSKAIAVEPLSSEHDRLVETIERYTW